MSIISEMGDFPVPPVDAESRLWAVVHALEQANKQGGADPEQAASLVNEVRTVFDDLSASLGWLLGHSGPWPPWPFPENAPPDPAQALFAAESTLAVWYAALRALPLDFTQRPDAEMHLRAASTEVARLAAGKFREDERRRSAKRRGNPDAAAALSKRDAVIRMWDKMLLEHGDTVQRKRAKIISEELNKLLDRCRKDSPRSISLLSELTPISVRNVLRILREE